MKRALIVYFSQGGTNARVGEAIGGGLGENGFQVVPWNLKAGPPPTPLDFDVFGIGTPTYYYRAQFKKNHNLPVSFGLFWMLFGGAFCLAQLFQAGCLTVWELTQVDKVAIMAT
jgi:hypothetical protein